ncbi:aminoglycoside phosphotransferase family protein [Microbacterium sulfonylureivorans]|uniref:aminoglycoside phosphotransferase family protein n=1 Tax=Microbacterium sulfonylureivorans TaxID=2486854 RepID=UPI000FDB88C6|nr:aminoglycoside phosphotransferase family protein [Microbacterium sulfonylureivorans]
MPALTSDQTAVLTSWLRRFEIVEDLSWGQTDTVVLHVDTPDGERIVKAGGPANHHILRELQAHDGATDAWVAEGRAARLRHADASRRILVLDYLPGVLAGATAAALDPDVHRQAGALLRQFHDESSHDGDAAEEAAARRAVAWLDSPHRIDAETERRLREALSAASPEIPPAVPTHGDWQPRNWLVDDGVVRVIDFGRFGLRSAVTDFARLASQEWLTSPAAERAFFEGYGDDPRTPEHWRLVRLREAIGTAVWAHQVGAEEFERQGHRMIAEALA